MGKVKRPLVIAVLAVAISISNSMVGFAASSSPSPTVVKAVPPADPLTQWAPGKHSPGTIIDMSGITFQLRISSNPNANGPCNYTGTNRLPTNRYPVMNPDSFKATIDADFRGGRVIGDISPTANRTVWSSNGGYCNSAAVFMKGAGSTRQQVEAIRVDRAWDGFRMGGAICIRTPGSCHNLIRAVWVSNVRDDCVENDHLGGLSIQDSLFDSCYSGVSADATASSSHQNTDTIELNGVLLRLQGFPQTLSGKVGNYLLAPFKLNANYAPSLVVNNSIIALASYDPSRGNRWSAGWARIRSCSNNQLLWLSDAPFPSGLPKPPSCFTVKTGAAARTIWNNARTAWIARHPEVARVAGDPPVR